ncbi:MAG: hypothetical protein HY514_04070 [Candidatus Aenigmarchaeota archaeon]|nr:hypothetical protein [Candidatus Aenigmarchaeota archaeon]
MKNLFNFKRDPKILAALLLAMIAATLVYLAFFDILIPNVPDDSYRLAVGSLFVVPVIILVFGQTIIGGFFLHMLSEAANPKKADFLRALFVAAMMTFLFSLTYVMFPRYGPFYYIVFVYNIGPWHALPLVVAWTLSAITINTYLAHKLLGISTRLSFIAIALTYIGIIAAAS